MIKSVGIVGLGYVGWPLALLANSKKFKVVGIDIDQKKISNLRSKRPDIQITDDFSVITKIETVIICVPTPINQNRRPDPSPVLSAGRSISKYLQRDQLIVLESSVNPGFCEEQLIPSLESDTSLCVGDGLYLAHCPERINPGDTRWHVGNLPRVIGGFDQRSLEKALKFYKSLIDAPVYPMNSLKEAEAVKIVENSFRNLNIAFVNELAKAFSSLGIDIVNVINGAASKPFGFMPHYPGCGVGGHCIPVDPYYLIDYVRRHTAEDLPLLRLACEINESMPEYTVKLAGNLLKQMRIKSRLAKISLLGLTYKAGVPDTRESPALIILKLLREKYSNVTVYDPYVPEMSNVNSLDKALFNQDLIIISTDHKEFRSIKPDLLAVRGVKAVLDGKNCLDKSRFTQTGLIYVGVGR